MDNPRSAGCRIVWQFEESGKSGSKELLPKAHERKKSNKCGAPSCRFVVQRTMLTMKVSPVTPR